jgi:heptaprenyl diphosphate synthase
MRKRETGWPVRRVTRLGFLAAVGTSLFVLESLIPLPLPFLKVGLANISTLLALLLTGPVDALLVVLIRVVAGSLLTGSFLGPAFILALCAGVVSALVMGLLHRTTGGMFGPVGLSLGGSFSHVLTQLALVAILLVRNQGVFHLLPILLVTALLGGLIVGLVTSRILPAIGSATDPSARPGPTVRRSFTVGDALAVILLAIAIVASFAFAPTTAGTTAFIDVNGTTVGKLDMRADGVLTVRGARGDVRVEVHDRKVRIAEADCPNRVCVRTGWKDRAGDVIVCVPNRTVVRIVNEHDTEIRGITG